MEKPLISVVVPVYNVEKYLLKCVKSLLRQKYENYEILLVDDGSPDRCPEMIDALAKKYARIRAFHKTNGGLGDARNYGIQRATGEWIVVVDSDDFVKSTYLSDLWELKEKLNTEMVISPCLQTDEHGFPLEKKRHFQSFKVSGEAALWEVYAHIHVDWCAYNKLYPKWVLLKYPFTSGYYEDMACMYRIITAVRSIAIGNFCENYKYVQRSGSILNSQLSPKHWRVFDICKEFEHFVDENYPQSEVLKHLVYVRCTIQMLHKQQMNDCDYKKVFQRNRSKFRRNLRMILAEQRIPRKTKLFAVLLCTEPAIYKAAYTLKKKIG